MKFKFSVPGMPQQWKNLAKVCYAFNRVQAMFYRRKFSSILRNSLFAGAKNTITLIFAHFNNFLGTKIEVF